MRLAGENSRIRGYLCGRSKAAHLPPLIGCAMRSGDGVRIGWPSLFCAIFNFIAQRTALLKSQQWLAAVANLRVEAVRAPHHNHIGTGVFLLLAGRGPRRSTGERGIWNV